MKELSKEKNQSGIEHRSSGTAMMAIIHQNAFLFGKVIQCIFLKKARSIQFFLKWLNVCLQTNVFLLLGMISLVSLLFIRKVRGALYE